jgi:hypothetical protein
MRALELADLFRTAFSADSAFNDIGCFNDLSSGELSRSCLIFKVEDVPQNGTGTALEFTLHIWCESSADVADAATAHRELVAGVREKLHGSGKAALLSAVNADADYMFFGWSVAPDAPGIDGNHFRSSVVAVGSVDVL